MSEKAAAIRHVSMTEPTFTVHRDSHTDHIEHLLDHERQAFLGWLDREFAGHLKMLAKRPKSAIASDKPIVATFYGAPCELINDLRGPFIGDAPILESMVCYRIRVGRKYASRVLKTALDDHSHEVWQLAHMRTTDVVTAVIGPHDGHKHVLYTVYAGAPVPREPGDPSISSWDELETSRAFWSNHALV